MFVAIAGKGAAIVPGHGEFGRCTHSGNNPADVLGIPVKLGQFSLTFRVMSRTFGGPAFRQRSVRTTMPRAVPITMPPATSEA
jgi:hypothetical protein